MGKHPNHPQISPELTAKPHTRAASTEGLPREEPPLLTHGLEHPQGRMCKGAKQSRLGRGAFSISSAHVAQMREAGLQHQPSTSRTHLQLHSPEQTQPTAIYNLLRYQQGQQPAHKPTSNEGGAVQTLLEHFGLFTCSCFSMNTSCSFVTTSNTTFPAATSLKSGYSLSLMGSIRAQHDGIPANSSSDGTPSPEKQSHSLEKAAEHCLVLQRSCFHTETHYQLPEEGSSMQALFLHPG